MLWKCDAEEFQLFIVIARRIWLRRNAFLHEALFTHPNVVMANAQAALQDYQNAQEQVVPFQIEGVEGMEGQGKWTKPPLGWFKANWDTAIAKHTGQVKMGFVIQNHNGDMLAARNYTHLGYVEPTSIEAMATMVAIQLARDMGLMQVQLEGDAKVVIDVVLSSTPDWSRWGHLTEDIHTSLKSFYAWKMTFVSRLTN
jgi:hypothetical protein